MSEALENPLLRVEIALLTGNPTSALTLHVTRRCLRGVRRCIASRASSPHPKLRAPRTEPNLGLHSASSGEQKLQPRKEDRKECFHDKQQLY